MSKLLYEEDTYRIRGACFEVYKEKGSGFLEAVYQECLEIEMAHQGIPFAAQQEIALTYRGQRLRQAYKADLVCFGKIIVEIKAVSALADEHRTQMLNYLNATGMNLGLLVNFGHHPGIECERFTL